MQRRAEESLVYPFDILELYWRVGLSMVKAALERVPLA